MSGVFSLGIGTAGRMRRANTLAKAGSDEWTPACARETGFLCVLESGNDVAVFAPPPSFLRRQESMYECCPQFGYWNSVSDGVD